MGEARPLARRVERSPTLLLAVVFVLLRLFVILALPGLVLVWLCAALLEARYRETHASPSSVEKPPESPSRKR